MQHLPALDLAVVAAYLLSTMGIGFYFLCKNRQPAGFMAAGRSLPSCLVGMSIFATYVGSISFLAMPGGAYQYDWRRFTFSLSIPFAAWAATRFFCPGDGAKEHKRVLSGSPLD